MTPARRQKLEAALAIIKFASDRDALCDDVRAEVVRADLTRLGAQFETYRITNTTLRHTMHLADVRAENTFDAGESLILRWAANARKALAEGTDTNTPTDEEE